MSHGGMADIGASGITVRTSVPLPFDHLIVSGCGGRSGMLHVACMIHTIDW